MGVPGRAFWQTSIELLDQRRFVRAGVSARKKPLQPLVEETLPGFLFEARIDRVGQRPVAALHFGGESGVAELGFARNPFIERAGLRDTDIARLDLRALA